MNKIEKLIKEMCPDGVRYIKIEEFSNMLNGMTGVSNKWKEKGNCKFIDYMNCFKNFRIDVCKLENATVKNLNQNEILFNDILFTSSSETPDECCISSVIDNKIPKNIFLDDHLFLIRIFEKFKNEINPIFLNFYFHSATFRQKINKIVRGLTRFYVSKIDFMKIEVPIPPIKIQNEIVKILDTFTQLEAELEAELEARDKQYQYYRNKLLDFENNQKLLKKLFEKDNKEIDNKIEYKPLKSIGLFYSGLSGKTKNDFFDNANSKYITYLNVFNNHSIDFEILENVQININEKQNKVKYGDILFTVSSETLEECGISSVINKQVNGDVYLNSFCFGFRLNDLEKFDINYLKHLFKSKELRKQIIKCSSGVTRYNLSKTQFENVNIPIPSLEIQTKIVNILDKLQDYSKDIKTGLPLEIEQRQKQYEYYRDLLLDFKANAQGGALANSYIELLNSIEKKYYIQLNIRNYENW